MKKPNITELKIRSEIPVDAKFIGWLIYDPFQNYFLSTSRETDIGLTKRWVSSLETALKFKQHKKAIQQLEKMELRGTAVLAAAFDCKSELRFGI